ncbi:CoxG family protein [Candidatus Uabimicrobium amorphum]|uniref:Carbon monoxide dehydrogenase subunit G n=1 Tax=Uabimicrobium amorphum TaxID=2596890 RepID=A0A5S9ISP1_UABAM|nr:carbon monoxide dehydrogenase subunit G [Candidatus Uabimicrobium amorphum]BBM87438.1 carbon monoxide dehydrogenase subunit G [Candidatus Uabimicrobium amorphum]
MKLEGEFTFKGSREEVWDLLQDPDVLITALPGAKKMEKTEEDKYEAEMEVKVGPVSGSFSSKIQLSDKVEPESYTMVVNGKGKSGFVKGKAQISLEEKTESETLMKYAADLQVGGKLASVGQRLLDTVGKSMARQSLESMNAALEHQIDPRAKTEYIPPSQVKFAVGVAKDVAEDSVKNPMFWGILGVVGVGIAAVIWYFVK